MPCLKPTKEARSKAATGASLAMSLGRIPLRATRSATRALPGHRMDEITSDISGDAPVMSLG